MELLEFGYLVGIGMMSFPILTLKRTLIIFIEQKQETGAHGMLEINMQDFTKCTTRSWQ